MIGILTQNNVCRAALEDLLSDREARAFQDGDVYDVVVAAEPLPQPLPNITVPVVALGCAFPGAAAVLPIPVSPARLIRQVAVLCPEPDDRITFENESCLFRQGQRTLTLKATGTVIGLTEKENDLLACLATAFPETVSKETLLQVVWNYRADTETHTVESHVYALRQKLGDAADGVLITSPAGYRLAAGSTCPD